MRLDAVASPAGMVCLLALDHRDALRNAFARAGVAAVTEDAMLAVKERIAAALAEHASGILLDPDAVEHCRPDGLGLLVPLEEQGHEPYAGGRLTRLTAGFGVADAARLGADGCKLLVYYRTDHPETVVHQRDLVVRMAEQCHDHGLALVVEPLVYRLDGEDETGYRQMFDDLVVSAAEDVADTGADLVKLAYPGDEPRCERVTKTLGQVPWTLLGGSDVDADTFARQLEVACHAGASGFIAGRPIWGGVLRLPDAEQGDWLTRAAVPAFDRLTTIVHRHGRSIQ